MGVEFRVGGEGERIEIVDPRGQHWVGLDLDCAVDLDATTLQSVANSLVETTVCFEAASLRFDESYATVVRDFDFDGLAMQDELSDSIESGRYLLDISSPIKLYVELEGPFDVNGESNVMTVSFDGTRTVRMGARSLETRPPPETITVDDDPRSAMRAVSAMGSVHHTTLPERAYPTLRPHPPLIEHGDEVAIPERFVPGDTGIEIEVPPTHEAVYTVAPLAFYLGARVVAGDAPRLHAAGTTVDLGRDCPLADDVIRLTREQLLLDCVVRTVGLYQVTLRAANALAPVLPFDLEEQYGAPIDERTATYLDVQTELLREYLPQLPLTGYLPTTPDGIEALPYVLNRLGGVRPARSKRATVTSQSAVEAFTRDGVAASNIRSSERIELDRTSNQSRTNVWFGNGFPIDAAKGLTSGFVHRDERGERPDRISVTILCADRSMRSEAYSAEQWYDPIDGVPYDVTVRTEVTVADLDGILTDDGIDFVHFVGHASPQGLHCVDGLLDVRTLSGVAIDAFFLNACTSAVQARRLVDGGAIGGVATNSRVSNERATRMGRRLAAALSASFPLANATSIASDVAGEGEYVVVGDPTTTFANSPSANPHVVRVKNRDGGLYDVYETSVPIRNYDIGTFAGYHEIGIRENVIVPGTSPTVTLDRETLASYLDLGIQPLRLDGEYYFGDERLAALESDANGR